MRKMPLLLMILAVGAVGGLWAAATGVNGSRDQEVFQETTQMGDRTCHLNTSDPAGERDSARFGGCRVRKKN